jgi:tetratricopeptide (TPR) repeat protein
MDNADPQNPVSSQPAQPAAKEPKESQPGGVAESVSAEADQAKASVPELSQTPAGYAKQSSLVKEGLAAEETLELDRELSVKFANLGDLQLTSGKMREAKEYYRKALAVSEDLCQRIPDNTVFTSDLAVILEKMGDILRKQSDNEQAGTYYERSLTLCEGLYRKSPGKPEFVKYLAISHYKMAAFYEAIKEGDSAARHRELCYKALTMMKSRGMYVDAQLERLWQFLDKNKGKM